MRKEREMRNRMVNSGLKSGVRVACDEKTMKYMDMELVGKVNDMAMEGEVVFMCADEVAEYVEMKGGNKATLMERAYKLAEALGSSLVHCHYDRDYSGLYAVTVTVKV